jgi:hypothetical protein
MRRLALAAIALIALNGSPADAQLGPITGPGQPVFDFASATQLLKSLGVENEQLTQLISVLDETTKVYTTATNIWGAVERVVGADQWAPGLNSPAARNPLPFAASEQPSWVGGFNDPGALPFGAQYMSQNTVGGDASVYNDGSFAGTEILKATQALSSLQAIAANHVQAIELRINALNDLFVKLASIGKLQETESLSARFNSELNYANSQVVQALQVQSAAQMQLAVLENNQRQWMYQDEANGIKAACATANTAASFITIPACLTPQ